MFRRHSLFRRYKYRYRVTPKPKKKISVNGSMSTYHNNFQHKLQGIIALAFIITIFFLIYIQLDQEVMPSVAAMADLKATTVATRVINEAVNESLMSIQATEDAFLSYDYNDQGELVSWNVNSILINVLCADVIDKATEKLQNLGSVVFEIPLGNLTGSRIFANLGPNINVEVLPIGTVEVDYANEIASTGINQVNHTVWLEIKTTVQVVVPLFTNQIVVDRRVMLVDKMISGDVPPSYVNVPGDSILDVAPGEVEAEMLPNPIIP